MSKMKELYQMIETLANDRQKKLDEIQNRIEAQKAINATAAEEAADAFDHENVKGYHSAQDKQRAAQDAIQMLEAKLAKVKEAPRLTAVEYSDIETQIRAEFDAVTSHITGEVEKHISALAALMPGLADAFQTGEKALHLLQFDVMNDAPFLTLGDGRKIPTTVGEKHLDGYSMYSAVEAEAGKQLVEHTNNKW